MQDVNSQNMICGQPGYTSQTVLSVKAGDRIGAWWQHIIGGPQGSGDPDNPIAHSHKGPVMAYMAKVNNAASTGITGLKWYVRFRRPRKGPNPLHRFKIWQDAFDTSSRKWGVDNLINNNGWVYFNLPQCIAPGQYLLRVEVLALHSAHQQGGAQFYQSCAQINVSGSGSTSPGQTVSIPGVYSANDPGIYINIYGSNGQPDNGGKPYTAPGPSPITC